MDILNSDLQLKIEATAKKHRSKDQDDDAEDATFHFIAFMPVMGQLWKFDGLERQPQALGMLETKYVRITLLTPVDRRMFRGQLVRIGPAQSAYPNGRIRRGPD
jgi:ubiquitin carboxyl-terminal hydrolase L5